MAVLSAIDALGGLEGSVHLAIGVFDGVHRGHQAVLDSAITSAQANDGIAVVATFHPHPAEVLAPDKAPKRLTPLAHQAELFQQLGMHATLAIPFDLALAGQSAEAFIERLAKSCQLASIHVGVDWAFGKGRHGNLELLKELGSQHGFSVYGETAVLEKEERISSTAIRLAVSQGKLDRAATLLGRPYSLFGKVVQGDQIGRTLGFPTANLAIETEALPPYGVYVVRTAEGPGVANLGVRPTIGGELARRFEVHLLDWEGDLYGKTLEAEFLHQIRPEMRFEGLPELQAQIAQDLSEARNWLSELS